jgi:hypothetical protein
MYGVLKTASNTGADSELQYGFSTPLMVLSNKPAFLSDTMSLKRKVNSQNVQRWEITANVMPENDTANFLVHSAKYAYASAFYIRMPQVYKKAKITETMTLASAAAYAQGTSLMNMTGLGSVDITGQFINFAGDSKVYLVTKGGSGGVGLEIEPPLLKGINSGTAIVYGDKTIMQAYYDADVRLGIQYTDGILSDAGSVRYIEAL